MTQVLTEIFKATYVAILGANLQISRTKKIHSGTQDIASIHASYCSWRENEALIVNEALT